MRSEDYEGDVLKVESRESDEPDGRIRDDIISDLIARCADPIIRRHIYHRLGLRVNPRGGDNSSPDAEDVYQTVMLRLVKRLRVLPPSDLDPADPVLKGYIRTIALNVCNSYLRSKYPERNRLKSRIRDMLRRHGDMTYWKLGDQIICGFSRWKGRPESEGVEALAERLERDLTGSSREALIGRKIVEGPFSGLIAELFHQAHGPIDLENLVVFTAGLQGIREHAVDSLDDEAFREMKIVDQTGSHIDAVHTKELLRRVWHGLCEISLSQRKAFLLTAYDHAGESLLHRLVREQLVMISEIYRVLEMNRDELISIWSRLPMDTETAALEMGCSIRMIAKWRHRALKRLSAYCGLER